MRPTLRSKRGRLVIATGTMLADRPTATSQENFCTLVPKPGQLQHSELSRDCISCGECPGARISCDSLPPSGRDGSALPLVTEEQQQASHVKPQRLFVVKKLGNVSNNVGVNV